MRWRPHTMETASAMHFMSRCSKHPLPAAFFLLHMCRGARPGCAASSEPHQAATWAASMAAQQQRVRPSCRGLVQRGSRAMKAPFAEQFPPQPHHIIPHCPLPSPPTPTCCLSLSLSASLASSLLLRFLSASSFSARASGANRTSLGAGQASWRRLVSARTSGCRRSWNMPRR